MAANAVDSEALPPEPAGQHDHYLYGRPPKDKRRQGSATSPIRPFGERAQDLPRALMRLAAVAAEIESQPELEYC